MLLVTYLELHKENVVTFCISYFLAIEGLMDGNNNGHEESLTSPIIMQTHAYFMSPPAAGAVDQRDVQQQTEEEETAEQQGEVLSMLAFEVETLSPVPAADSTAEGTASVSDNTDVPAIERSGTSATEGTEDYSSPSSPASAPSTPTRGTKQRPAATPAGPAERTRRDEKLSMLYTPVKGENDAVEVSMEDGSGDDFLENESGYEKRKLPCSWVTWVALVVFVGGALVMTTGIVVHNKKQNAAAASLLYQDNAESSGDQVEGGAIVLETESTTMDDNIQEEVATIVLETESTTMDDNIQEEVATNVVATGEAEVEPSSLSNTPSPTFTTDYPTLSPTIEPTLGPTPSAASITIETPAIQEKPKTEQSNQKPPKEQPTGTTSVTVTREKMTYRPGDLTVSMNGLLLSAGLTATIIAKSGKPVMYSNGKTSDKDFHEAPDFGGVFPLENGGWIYVSNSEVDKGKGGVGAITFNSKGGVVKYEKLLKGTSMNCGGGEFKV